MPSDSNAKHTDDPQLILTAQVKEREKSDVIVFTMDIYFLKMTFIIPIPEEGSRMVPVYVKFRVGR